MRNTSRMKELQTKNFKLQTLKKHWLNILLGIFIILMLFYPPAKVWVLQRVMDTGLFNQSGNKETSYHAQPMSFRKDDGTIITTAALKGKVIFINFWATWCPPCLAELPSIQNLYNQYKTDTSIVFILADADNNIVESKRFLSKRSLDLPVYGVATQPDSTLYSGSLPTTIMLDPEGLVILNHAGIGKYDTEKMFQLINQHLRR